MVAFAHDADEGTHWASLARGAAPVLPAILALWTVGLSIAARGEVIAVPAAGLWPCVRCRHAMHDSADTCPDANPPSTDATLVAMRHVATPPADIAPTKLSGSFTVNART